MKILVTGGTGFIGKNLTVKLIDSGHDVSITTYHNERIVSGVSGIYSNDLTELNERFDVVFHQAANNDTRDMNRDAMFRSNVYKPITMFHNLRRAGCVKFIYASSTAVYGNNDQPLNPYAESKKVFDDFAMDFAKSTDSSVIGLRYCNVYGPGENHKGKRMSMVSQIYNRAKEDRPVKLFKYGEQKRDWLHVADAVNANMRALLANKSDIYNIGTGETHSFNTVLELIKKTLQREIEVSWIDCPFKDQYQTDTGYDISKAASELGYFPSINLKSGIETLSFN